MGSPLEDVEGPLLAATPDITILKVPGTDEAALLASARHADVRIRHVERKDVVAASVTLVVLAHPGDGARRPLEEDYKQTLIELEYWTKLLAGRCGRLAGTGFAARYPGIVEAVSQHALQLGARLTVAAGATWWLPSGL